MSTLHIRGGTPADAAAIRAVHTAAFGGQDEAGIVEALRVSGASIVSLVAVDARDHIVGHILFSPVAIDAAEGRSWVVGLAPLGVLPEHQRTGVGAALVRRGLEELRREGHGAVVVLGHPEYYARFGFRPAGTFDLKWEVAGHEAAFMAQELTAGALRGGVVRYRPEVMGFGVRRAEPSELASVQAIEVAAATRFRNAQQASVAAVGAVADAPPLALDVLTHLQADGRLWVVTSKQGELAAFVAWEPMERDAYITELDVHPAHARARLGAALLDHVALVAKRQGLARLLLRTFSDVPWNAPYYRKLGFEEITAPTTLHETMRHEKRIGLDPARRVTMARALL